MKQIIYIFLITISFSLDAQDPTYSETEKPQIQQTEKDSLNIKEEKIITLTFNKKAFKSKMKKTKEKIVTFYDKQIEKHLERKERRRMNQEGKKLEEKE